MLHLNFLNTFLCTCLAPSIIFQKTEIDFSSTKEKNSITSFTPHHLINDHSKYYDSYDVFLFVNETGCGLNFQTNQKYFISFDSYVRNHNTVSLAEEHEVIMNYGDVILGIEGVDIEGKLLQEVKYKILSKSNTTIN